MPNLCVDNPEDIQEEGQDGGFYAPSPECLNSDGTCNLGLTCDFFVTNKKENCAAEIFDPTALPQAGGMAMASCTMVDGENLPAPAPSEWKLPQCAEPSMTPMPNPP